MVTNCSSFLHLHIPIIYQVAQQAGNKELGQWVPTVITHFWYASQHCGDDENDTFKKEEIMKVVETYNF